MVRPALNTAPKISDFAVYAHNSATVRDRAMVSGGDVGVKGAGTPGPFLESGFELSLISGARVQTTRNVIGDSVKLTNQTVVGDVQTNNLVVSNPVTFNGPFAFPSAMPSLPSVTTPNPGTTNVTVNSGQTVTLSPGRFAAVNVNTNARLKLNAGAYDFASVAMGNDSRIEVLGAVNVRVSGRFGAIDRSHFVTAAGTSIPAGSIRVEISGKNGATGALSATPRAAVFGNDSELVGLWLVPNGTLMTGQRSVVTGALAARDVYVDIDARVNFQGGFPNPACVPVDCNDADPCTTDSCNNGTCSHAAAPDGTSCSDNNACTNGDSCRAGACQNGNQLPVDDGNSCTIDSCDPATGIKHTNVAPGTSCSDGNACNGDEVCDGSGVCESGTAVVCGVPDQCHAAGVCDPVTGLCSNPRLPDQTECSDGNACTTSDVCIDGACSPGPSLPAPRPPTLCESALCVAEQGWVYTPYPAQTSCSDGDACNGEELCDGYAVCQAGEALVTEDDNPCTIDACDPLAGVTHDPVPDGTVCAPGNLCEGEPQSICRNAQCLPHDGTFIPNDSDGYQYKVYGYGSVPSDYGTFGFDEAGFATGGAPFASGGGCPIQAKRKTTWPLGTEIVLRRHLDLPAGVHDLKVRVAIDNDIEILFNETNITGGIRSHEGCADSNQFEFTIPDSLVKVGHNLIAIRGRDRGVEAALDIALTGEVANGNGEPPVIDDGNPCTVDSCDPVDGITHAAVPDGTSCGDENICNGEELCVAGECTLGTPLPEPPEDPQAPPGSEVCSSWLCDPTSGWMRVNAPDGTACDDGVVCNGADACDGAGVCVAGSSTIPGCSSCVPPPSGMVGWWPGDDTAADIQAGHHGSLIGGLSFGAGKVESAFAFGELDGSVLVPDAPEFDVQGGFTIDVWVSVASLRSSQYGYNIVGRSRTSDTVGIHLRVDPSGTRYRCNIDNGPTDFNAFSTTPISFGVFQHVACTFDGTTLRTYVNGILESSIPAPVVGNLDEVLYIGDVPGAPLPFQGLIDEVELFNRSLSADEIAAIFEAGSAGKCKPQFCDPASADDGNPCTVDSCDPVDGITHAAVPDGTSCGDENVCNGEELCVAGECTLGTPLPEPPEGPQAPPGSEVCSSWLCDPTSGWMRVNAPDGTACDDGVVCNGADACFSGQCEPGGPPCPTDCTSAPSGLLGWWPGDGHARDLAGPGDGALEGSVGFAAGQVEEAFRFVEGQGRVNLGDDPNLNFGTDQSFSIEGWIQIDGFTGQSVQTIAMFNDSCTTKRQMLAVRDTGPTHPFWPTTAGTLMFEVGGSTARNDDFVASPTPLSLGELHHVAATRDVTGGERWLNLFVDGSLVATAPDNSIGSLSSLASDWIGGRTPCGDNAWFNGLIDELSVYGRALTEAEVRAIYDAGSSGKCEPETPVGPPPVLSNIHVTNITSVSAVVRWTTDVPADSRVRLGPTLAYGTSAGDGALVTEHAVPVSALTPETLYHYEVASETEAGGFVSSLDHLFSTLEACQIEFAPPPDPQPIAHGPGRWEKAGNTSARHPYGATATALRTGDVLVVGGLGSEATGAADLFSPGAAGWVTAPPLPGARYLHTATLLDDGRVLVAGGASTSALSSAELFDPVSRTWSSAAPMPSSRDAHAAVKLLDGRVLVIGGEGPGGYTASTALYDPIANSWISGPALGTARASFVAALLPSGKVVVAGGRNASGTLASTEVYDPSANSWTLAGNLAAPRYMGAGAVSGGKLVVTGGTSGSTVLSSAEVFDPVTSTWSSAGELSAPRTEHVAVAVPDGRVLFLGGGPGTGSTSTTRIAEVYDPSTQRLSNTAWALGPRRSAVAAVMYNGDVLLAGGEPGTERTSEIYRPNVTGWQPVAPMNVRRHDFASLLLPDGRVFVAGGFEGVTGRVAPSATAELYDPVGDTWQRLPDMSTPRARVRASLLPDGRVLVAGGIAVWAPPYTTLTSAEIFDPASNTWEPAAPMVGPRYVHAMTLLCEQNRVLATGGNNGSPFGVGTETIPSAELYDPTANAWTTMPEMASPRLHHSANLLPGGMVLLAAGNRLAPGRGELFDPDSLSWSPGGEMQQVRYKHRAVNLPDGRVLVAGGFDAGGTVTARVEVYDPSFNAWTETAPLSRTRVELALSLIDSTHVLAAGGWESGSSEIYDIESGNWSPAPAMNSARGEAGPVRLLDGRVLVAGGLDQADVTQASVELYQPAVDAPVAPTVLDDDYAVESPASLTVAAPGVLANDSAGVTTAVLTREPAHGVLSLSPDGSFTYTAAGGFAGIDSFAYRSTLGGLSSNEAIVWIAVTADYSPVAVPNVIDLPLSPAVSIIETASLQVGNVTSSVDGLLELEFDALPSQRGWPFVDTAGSSEEGIFRVEGGVLFQDSLRAGFGASCGSLYTKSGLVRANAPFTLEVRARVLDAQELPTNHYGFAAGAGTASGECGFGLGEGFLQDAQKVSVATDTANFHDYRVECDPTSGTSQIFVDDELLVSSGVANVGLNRIYLGDGTCGANARAEVTKFRFEQRVVSSEDPPAGTLVPPDSEVDLDLSTGPVTARVPAVGGVAEDQAIALVEQAGLEPRIVREHNPATPAGTVIRSVPLADTHAAPNDEVTLFISKGPPSCVAAPSDMRAWFRAEGSATDEVSGLVANQVSTGGVSYRAGEVGQGFALDHAELELPHSSRFEFSGQLTAEAWVRLSSGYGTIFEKSGAGSQATISLFYQNDQFGFTLWAPNASSYAQVFSPKFAARLGEWTHVAVVANGTTLAMFVNGQQVASVAAPAVGTNSGNFEIGAGGSSYFYGGGIDELSIYGRALSASEIAAIYDADTGGKCLAPFNAPPVLNAGADFTTQLGEVAMLDGTATDDGLPFGILDVGWRLISGPGGISLPDPNSASTQVTFHAAGTYVLELIATDGEFTSTDSVEVTVEPIGPPVNQPPVVDAGPDLSAFANEGIVIHGSYTDDGLPTGGPVSFEWGVLPGAPTHPMMDENTELTLDVLFPEPGFYELVLFVNDGELKGFDTVEITVLPRPNQAPNVSAGPDRAIAQPAGAALAGVVTDDGLPEETLTSIWTKVSGPGAVTFDSETSPATVAHFSASGSYVLRLTATDSVLSAFDDVAVEVAPPPPNQAPVVAAGSDAEVRLPDTLILPGSVADDGLPIGSPLVITWSLVSGPAPVAFSPANTPSTTATFTKAGVYTLRLSGSDDELSAHDDVAVRVLDPITGDPPEVAILSPLDGDDLTKPTSIIGTAASPTLDNYVLEYRLTGGSNWTTFATGTTPVSDASLGTLDSTLLLNGAYDLRLTATDTAGQFSQTSLGVVLSRNLKVGHFTVSFRDLSVPLAGVPIEVIRTYDSRNKEQGDFGVGWTLDIATVRVQKNRVLGQTWETTREPAGPFGILEAYCVVPSKRHYVTVTFADGKVFRWEAKVQAPGPGYNGRRECQLGSEFVEAEVEFVPLAPTTAALSRLGGNDVIVNAAWEGEAELLSTDGSSLFDPEKFVVTLHDGRELNVGMSGLEQITDTNGNVLEIRADGLFHSTGSSVLFARDSQGRITTITDPEGNDLTYAYGPTGDLASFTDRASSTTEYAYDGQHYLLGIQDARGIQPIQNEYDTAGRLLAHTDAFGNTISYDHQIVARTEIVTDRLGNQTTHEYDDRGNILKTTDALGESTTYVYDDRDNTLSECNPLDECTEFTYDDFDNKLTEEDPLGNVTRYEYDSRGNVTKIVDPLEQTTTSTYDGASNLVKTIDAAGGVTEYTYDARGLQTSMKDALGHTTFSTYDASGNLLTDKDAAGHVTSYTYDANGNRLTQTTTRTIGSVVETLTTTFNYDTQGRLVSTVGPDGATTSTEYDEVGQVSADVDALGHRTEHQYDDMGGLVAVTYADGTTESTEYDQEGRRVASTDRAGHETEFSYDAVGRIIATTFPDGTATSTTYDAAGRTLTTEDEEGNVTSEEYDAAGRRVKTTDPLGHATSYVYDETGNQLSTTDPLGHTTTYVYDALNRRTEVHFADSTSETTEYDAAGRRTAKVDQAGLRTEYGYDPLGRLTSVTDALDGVTSYVYDEAGNQVRQIDALGHVTSFAYDEAGRRTRRTLPSVGGAPGAFETMGYDPAGNLIEKTDFAGRTTHFTYDVVNRLLTKTYPDTSVVSFTYTPTGRRASMTDARGVTTFTYDARDRVTTVTYPGGGRSLSYGYTLRGSRATLTATVGATARTTTYDYDDNGRLSEVVDPAGGTYAYAYDAAGRRTGLTQPNDTETTYGYDSVNHLTELETKHTPTNTVIHSYAYTLGATGIRTRIEESGGIARAYEYDDLYRLTGETVTGTSAAVLDYTKTFTYDAVGNRLAQITTGHGATSVAYAYDERDRLLTENATSYGWDVNGNMVSRSGDAAYTWDYDDRLIRVTKSDGTIVDHTYDPDGVRVRTVVTPPGGGTPEVTDYLVDTAGALSHVVAETDAAGELTAHYVRGGDQLLSVLRSGTVRYYHADGLGSVRALTDENGDTTDAYAYTAFGEDLSATGSDGQPYRFAGEERGSLDASYYLRARHYSATLGVLLGTDPCDGELISPGSLHDYAYAGMSPASFSDPTGRFTLAQIAVTAVLAVISVVPPWGGDGSGFLRRGIFTIPSGSPLGRSSEIVTSKFGQRVLMQNARPYHDFHEGVDIRTKPTPYLPVRATADGVVEAAGWGAKDGIFVRIGHSQIYTTQYHHLRSENVQPRQHVRKGEVIGYSGMTGTTAFHLHYRVEQAGKAIDPVPSMRRGGVAITFDQITPLDVYYDYWATLEWADSFSL